MWSSVGFVRLAKIFLRLSSAFIVIVASGGMSVLGPVNMSAEGRSFALAMMRYFCVADGSGIL